MLGSPTLMYTTRTIIKNVLSLSVGSIFTKLLTVVVIAYTARILAAEGYGRYSFAVAVSSYLGLLAEMGLNPLGTRELARHRDHLNLLVRRVLTLKLLGAL